ncbi:Sulfofructosephosphate aldolase [Candidatus Burarchaeum australiense]|nr:Sulfofructosephosphate aldolase [Candidatus Burarchaeum australiense]
MAAQAPMAAPGEQMSELSIFGIAQDGLLTLLAADHRTSLRLMLNPAKPASVSASALLAAKCAIVKAISPFASATLLDYDSAIICRKSGALAQNSALLAALEKSGFSDRAGERVNEPDPHATPLKARKAGAAAVKLLLYYNPRYHDSTARQLELLKVVRKSCLAAGIPLVLEVKHYEIPLPMWEGAVLGSARDLSPYCDALGLQFPTNSIEEAPAAMACKRLSDAIRIPWFLLTDQSDFLQFLWQLEIACKGGASGFSAGRTVWGDAMRLPAAERERYLNVVCAGRFIRLQNVVLKHGRRIDELR